MGAHEMLRERPGAHHQQARGVLAGKIIGRQRSRSGGTPEPIVAVGAATTGESLPGLPSYLEAPLAQAQQQGVEEFGKWLRTWGRQIQDPRLAWIELDYVVLLNLKDHKAAREKFLQVLARVAPDSPVYDRVQKLAPAYEQ